MALITWEGSWVLVLCLNLFCATLMKSGLIIFGCVLSPNDTLFLTMFPFI